MRRPRQPSGMAAGRGTVLLVVAVILGIVLLNAADDPPPDRVSATTDDETASTTSTTFAETTLPTLPLRPPAEVKVLAANGTTAKGVARKATDQLKAAGYNVLSPTDSQRADISTVYFTGDYQREGAAVAEAIGIPPTSVAPLPVPPPLADARGANVVVVIGPELAERLNAPAPAATTATTAAGATSTTTG